MSVPRHTLLIDWNGSAVAVFEEKGAADGRGLALTISRHDEKSVGAFLNIADAKYLGEWLAAWAEEREEKAA